MALDTFVYGRGPAQDVPYDIILWYVSKNLLFNVGIGPILSNEIDLIYHYDHSDCAYV